MKPYTSGVVLHVPHHSTMIPSELRDQFVLNDDQLQAEVIRMTDHHTLELFGGTNRETRVVSAPISRLVVDVERFEQDDKEPMAAIGMGTIYRNTSEGKPLRRELSVSERNTLISAYYHPHHWRLIQLIDACLLQHQIALIIDCHSFPSVPLPYEHDQNPERPDVCIGTDEFHTPEFVREAFVTCFESEGFAVRVNTPFAGAIVPSKHYLKDKRVLSVMVEINRRLYLDEATGTERKDFIMTSGRVTHACWRASALVMARENSRE